MAKDKEKIVLCGHYGATNIGDEAIGLSLVQNLKKLKPEAKIVILSYDPHRTKHFYEKYAPELDISSVYLLPLGFRSFARGLLRGELWHTLKEIRSCNKFILGGGGLFTDEKLFAVFLWGIHAFWAYIFKKPVLMIGQSVGPLKSKTGKLVVKKMFSRAKYINVRDNESKNLLKKIGIRQKILVSTDAVFGLDFYEKIIKNKVDRELNKKCSQNGQNGYFIFSIRPWKQKTENLYKNIIQDVALISKKYKLLPVFVPFQLIKENDQKILSKIIVQNDFNIKIEVRKFTDDIFEIFSLISGAKFVFGVRLHSLLFSVINLTPFLGFSYSPKIRNFFKNDDTDLSKYILNLNAEDLSDDTIDDMIARIMANRSQIVDDLTEFKKTSVRSWNNHIKNLPI